MNLKTFREAANVATKVSDSWNNRETIIFHAYNKNGLAKRYLQISTMLPYYEKLGVINVQFILDFYNFDAYDNFMALTKKQKVRTKTMQIAINALKDDLDTILTELGDKILA